MTPKKVLILEDDIFLVKVMKEKFEQKGHSVVILLNGSKAVKTSIEKQPDVILLDLMMPETDGFKTIKNLKDNQETANIPIIVASNLDSDKDIRKAKKMNVSHYFVKSSVSLDEVIEYIGNLQ